ncbi:MAG: VanZ family protein [Clostridiales bacterium]|nr:VanZ family protein [Clostridiales bacterium]
MNRRKFFKVFVFILLFATLSFIFSNSLEPAAESSEKSEGVMHRLAPILGLFFGKENVTDHLVRKTAHFCEFFALGSELFILAALYRKTGFQGFFNCLFAGLSAAVTDESLQMLTTDRSSQVSDILLDFSGVFAGVMVVLAVILIIKFFKKS